MHKFFERIPEHIRPHVVTKRFDRGEAVLLPGEENEYIYQMIEGVAVGYHQSFSGSMLALYHFGPGDIFGELEIFHEESKTIGITARTDCTLKMLHKQYLLEWLRGDFSMVEFMYRHYAKKLWDSLNKVEELSMLSVKQRVLHCVLNNDQMGTLAELDKRTMVIECGAPIRSVNRAIAACCDEGLINYENKRFCILDRARVEEELL